MRRGEDGAAVLVGQDAGLKGVDVACRLHDLGLVHADERAQDGQILRSIGALQGLDSLAGHLSQTLAGNKGFAALLFGNNVGNAHHAAAHQHREQHIRSIIPDVLLRLGVGHDEQIGAARIDAGELRQCLHLELCALRSVRRRRKVDVVQCQTALCHAVSCHGAVDAARQHVQRTAAGAHGQTALTGYFRAVNIRAVITNFYDHLKIRVMHIYLEVVVLAQQVSAQLPHQFRAGHGVGLVGAAGFHLEGADAVQTGTEVILSGLADGVKVLVADHGAAERRKAEHLAHPVKGEVHIHVLFLRLHVKGGLGAVDLELAHGLEPVAQNFHHRRLELVAVEAFQGHFTLIAHDNFMHKCCIS